MYLWLVYLEIIKGYVFYCPTALVQLRGQTAYFIGRYLLMLQAVTPCKNSRSGHARLPQCL